MLNKEENEKIWRERVANWRASGKSQRKWCEEENLPYTSLRYWMEKINYEEKQKNMPEWIDLELGENKIAKLPVSPLVKGNEIEISIGKASVTIPMTAEVKIRIC